MALDFSEIGERIRIVIKERNISSSELSKRLGVSKASVSQWIKGKNLTLKTLALLSSELDISLNWIIYNIGDSHRISSLKVNDKEEALLYIMRHIKNDITSSITNFLQSMEGFISTVNLNRHVPTDKIFELSKVAASTISIEGYLLESNAYHNKLIGLDPTDLEHENIYFLEFIAPEYKSKLKQVIASCKTGIKGDYCYFEMINIKNSKRIPVITKASLSTYNGELAINVLVKPVDADVR